MELAFSESRYILAFVCLQPVRVSHRERPYRPDSGPDVGLSTSPSHYRYSLWRTHRRMFRGTRRQLSTD